MSRANLIFLATCGAAWLLLHQLIAVQNQQLVFEDQPQPGRAPLLRIRRAGRLAQTLPVRILFIHGLSASKSAMKQMAAEIARWGGDCYLMDLPGHGSSPEPFSLQATVSATDHAVRELLAEPIALRPSSPVVIIGHSFGGRVALGAARRFPQIASVVALAPAAEPFAPGAGFPLLILIGEFDFPFVRRGATFLYEQVTGAPLPSDDKPGQWQTGSSRLVVLPWTDHSQTLFRANALREIKTWLTGLSPLMGDITFSSSAYWARIELRVAFCVLSLLVWFPAVGLLVDMVLERKPSRDVSISEAERRFKPFWAYALGVSLSIIFLSWTNPWERLRLMGGDYLSGLICLTGVFGLAVQRPKGWRDNSCWRALLCSFLAWLLLVMGCAPWITREFAHLELSSVRFWRLPWISLSVLPFFLLDEQVCRRMLQCMSRARVTMFHLSTRFILAIALLLGFFVLRTGQFLVVLMLPGLLLTSLLCWCMAAWIHRKTDSLVASGLFAALTTGWFFSVFFTQL